MENILISLINLLSLILGGIAIGLIYKLTRRADLPFLNYYFIFLICAVITGFCDWIIFTWVRILVLEISDNTADFIYHIFWDLIGFPAYLFAFYYLIRTLNSLLTIHIRSSYNRILVFFLITLIILDYTGFYYRLQDAAYIFSKPLFLIYTIILPFAIPGYLAFAYYKLARSRVRGIQSSRFILLLLVGFVLWSFFSFIIFALGEWRYLIVFIYYLAIFVPALFLYIRQKDLIIKTEIQDGDKLEMVLRDYKFTDREIELALLLMDGKSNQEISDELFISTQTVKNYISKMYRHIDVKNRIQFVNFIRSSSS